MRDIPRRCVEAFPTASTPASAAGGPRIASAARFHRPLVCRKRCESSGAPTPCARVLALMHARAHLNGRRRGEQPIVHGIRKLIEEAAPQGAMHDRAGLGMLLDHLQDSLDIREEVLAQPGPRRGIPRVRIRHIVSSECRELDSPDHDPPRRTLRLTSSHVRSPTSLTSASRSSSNSRCQSGTGTLSGDATKLAHASSISRIRSSGGSCSTWSRIGGDAIRRKLLRTSCPRNCRRRAGRLAKRTLARSDGRVVADGGAAVLYLPLTPFVLRQRSKQNAVGRATPACRTPPRADSSNVPLAVCRLNKSVDERSRLQHCDAAPAGHTQ